MHNKKVTLETVEKIDQQVGFALHEYNKELGFLILRQALSTVLNI